MQPKSPLFSIVIATYKFGAFLETAIQSVLSQSCQDFELIVVDGGSTDNSVDIIKKYQDRIAWWCSEPDKGQSDAFNKGFAHAIGRFGCWLNADDIMMPNALDAIQKYLKSHPKAEWIGGSMIFLDSEMNVLWCSRCMRVISRLYRWLPAGCVNGPSSFYSLEKMRSVGGFDEDLFYTMDIDLWRKFFAAGLKLHHVKSYLWAFRVHTESKTSHGITGESQPQYYEEGGRVNAKYGCSRRKAHIGTLVVRFMKLISGVYLWSFIDTWRYKGKSITLYKS